MTRMRFRCYHCGRIHAIDQSASGKRGRCLCGKVMVVPEAAAYDEGTMPVASPVPEGPESEAASFGEDSDLPVPRVGRLALGALEILGSFAALAFGCIHSFRDALVARGFEGLPDPNYFNLPANFWATVVFTLSVLLFIDGRKRLKGLPASGRSGQCPSLRREPQGDGPGLPASGRSGQCPSLRREPQGDGPG